MDQPFELSIVTGTLNRRHALAAMIQSVRPDVSFCKYEIICVDAGSDDGTQEWVRKQFDCVLIEEKKRLGAIHAYNHGFKKARGKYVAHLNDDCLLIGKIFKPALEQLEKDSRIGQVAFPFKNPWDEIHYDQVGLGVPKKTWRYANFGVTRKWLGDAVDWWSMEGNAISHYAGDTHCSQKIWRAGYKVAELASDGYIKHLYLEDETRVRENTDSPIFFAYWRDWKAPPSKPTIFENDD